MNASQSNKQMAVQEEEDAAVTFFYKPHSLTFLFISLATLIYVAFKTDDSNYILNIRL